MNRSTRSRLAASLTVAVLAVGGSIFTVGTGTAGADAVGDEASFRTAFQNATEIDLTADINLTCPGGTAERSNAAALVLRGHGFTIRQTCAPDQDESVLRTFAGDLTLDGVTLTGGSVDHGGGGLHFDGDGALRIVNSTFTGNQSCGDSGGGLTADDGASSVTIIGSTFTNNVSNEEGGAIRVQSSPADLTIVNSTITGNSSGSLGGAVSTENDANIVYSTIVANSLDGLPCVGPDAAAADDEPAGHPDGAAAADVDPQQIFSTNVGVEGALGIFGTVIALGQPSATPNCDSFNTTSSGYNFSDDDSCLQATATGDRENAGNPGLGALGSNGGPTQTMVPSDSSPLLNFIPIPACSGGDGLAGFAVTNDQRGILRPQSTGCEVGAVEVVLEVVVDFAG